MRNVTLWSVWTSGDTSVSFGVGCRRGGWPNAGDAATSSAASNAARGMRCWIIGSTPCDAQAHGRPSVGFLSPRQFAAYLVEIRHALGQLAHRVLVFVFHGKHRLDLLPLHFGQHAFHVAAAGAPD